MSDNRNVGASVLARLKNKAKANGDNFTFVLERYGIERLLYRLSISPYKDKFILKGGSLFIAWQGKSYRVTRDVDLLGYGVSDVGTIQNIFNEICAISVPADDGIIFTNEALRVSEIKETETYSGVRVKVKGTILKTQLSLQVDIGFGDAITPHTETIVYPTWLEMPAPKLKAYSKYTVIAEKFEALVSLSITNCRMKDFYDIWLMSCLFDFDGAILQQAINNTFNRRNTPIPANNPIALTEEFYQDSARRRDWNAFIKKPLETFGEQLTLENVAATIEHFIMPVVDALNHDEAFKVVWSHENRTWTE